MTCRTFGTRPAKPATSYPRRASGNKENFGYGSARSRFHYTQWKCGVESSVRELRFLAVTMARLGVGGIAGPARALYGSFTFSKRSDNVGVLPSLVLLLLSTIFFFSFFFSTVRDASVPQGTAVAGPGLCEPCHWAISVFR